MEDQLNQVIDDLCLGWFKSKISSLKWMVIYQSGRSGRLIWTVRIRSSNHPFESLSDDVLLDIQEKITADIKNQLLKSPSDRTRMLPTFVDKLPTGTESGDFLVLDFGGHFFRVAYVNIKKSEKILNSEQQRRIDQRRLTIRNGSILTSFHEPYVMSHNLWLI